MIFRWRYDVKDRVTDFCMGPDTSLFDALVKLHEREAETRNAEFTNFGKATGDDWIMSKTDRGILHTRIRFGEVMHEWEDY